MVVGLRSAGPTTSDRGNQHRQRQSALGFAQWSKHRVRGTNNRYRQAEGCLSVCLPACLPFCLCSVSDHDCASLLSCA